jgi:uncharacterized C2H2 Zn-finger protein
MHFSHIPSSHQTLSCPNCGKIVKLGFFRLFYLLDVRSKLGPPLFRCASCGAVFNSGLEEWAMMSRQRKIRYVLLSVFYALILSVPLSLETMLLVALFTRANRFVYQQLTSPHFPLWLLSFGSIVLLIQVLRIWLSLQRTIAEIKQPYLASFWSWQTNLQFWIMLLMVVGILAGYLARYIPSF